MKLRLCGLLVFWAAVGCSEAKHETQASEGIIAISFPGGPNPPTANLIRGTQNLAQIDPQSTEESMLTEAFLRCGLRRLSWTRYGTDGYSRLILPDNGKTRSAIKCVAKIFPLDFYAEPQRATKSDLETLTQTPR